MSWVLGVSRSVLKLSAMASSVSFKGVGGGVGVPTAAMWDLWSSNCRIPNAGARCLVFFEGRLLQNFDLQGLRSSRQYRNIAAPIEWKSKWSRTEWKKRRARGVTQAVSGEEGPHSVVVVESPSKAKTITKYLGPGYTVIPSYGHVRDLAARAGSVRPDDDFNMLWEVPGTARPHINNIKAALKGAQVLVLASDPDREGEAIAWHVLEMLTMEGALKKEMIVKRVAFHEITETAVTRAMESARDVSETLVNAYLARRALDYLIGFNLSPVLWRKLPGSKSAGRVQSAALRLICDREQEIEAFRTREYWTVDAQLKKEEAQSTKSGGSFTARLTHLKGEKLGQFSLTNDKDADGASKTLSEARLRVGSVKKRLIRRNPYAPYITSTLQQDASAKLGFGATRTMSIAQQLYEGVKLNNDEQTGLITYMRTDGVQISNETLDNIRSLSGSRYGEDYVPTERPVFMSKVKNAQEAHEAIRPTDIFRLPSSVASFLEDDALQLYTLIWARTMACQLEPAVFNQVSVEVVDDHGHVQLRASSSTLSFPGFLDVYKDTEALGRYAERLRDDNSNGETSDLERLEAGDLLVLSEARPAQHFTEPPPRFSEGTLVKQLEELGIGRPSTYAPTLRTLLVGAEIFTVRHGSLTSQRSAGTVRSEKLRNYVRIDKRRIIPESRGRMVSAFLGHYFPEFADFSFTANMESQLDEVSTGQANWKKVLDNFWPGFHENVLEAMKVPLDKVVEMLEEVLAKQFFPSTSSGIGDRACPSCKEGKVSLKLSRFGAGYFFGCSRYPDCLFKANMISGEKEDLSDEEDSEAPAGQWSVITRPAKVLGVDPVTQLQVVMRVGPYGPYVQLGEASKKQKPRRTTLPKGVKAEEVTLKKALELLSYPRELGKHPEEGTPITISIGKFGLFLRHRAIIASVPQGLKVEDMSVEKAVEILKGRNVSRRGRRPRKVAVEESGQETKSPAEVIRHLGETSSPNGSLSALSKEQHSNALLPNEKLRRKSKKVKKDSDLKRPVKDEGLVDSNLQPENSSSSSLNGTPGMPDTVIKRRGRGKPRKILDVSDRPPLLVAQGE